MQCRLCGAAMTLVARWREGYKVALRYACPKAECQGEQVMIRFEPIDDHGGEQGGDDDAT